MNAKDGALLDDLIAGLPDIPRWVETRHMLLMRRCSVAAVRFDPRLSFVIAGLDHPLVAVVGNPEQSAIRQMVSGVSGEVTLLCGPESFDLVAGAVPHLRAHPALIHRLGTNARLPRVPPDVARFASKGEIAASPVSNELREELELALLDGRVAAVFADGLPVSYCYASGVTETLWDISIDTLEPYRRRGLAGLCVAFLIEQMRKEGKEPVWGAEEENTASMKLAAKLGFVPVDRLIVFR